MSLNFRRIRNIPKEEWKGKMKFKGILAAVLTVIVLMPCNVHASSSDISVLGPDAAYYEAVARQQMSVFAPTLPAYIPNGPSDEEIMIQKAFDIYKYYGVDLDAIIPRLQGILPQMLAEPYRYGAIVGEDIAAWRLERQAEYATEYGTQLVFNYYRSTGLTPEQALEATQIAYGLR